MNGPQQRMRLWALSLKNTVKSHSTLSADDMHRLATFLETEAQNLDRQFGRELGHDKDKIKAANP